MEIVKSRPEGTIVLFFNGKLISAEAGAFNASVEEAVGESSALVLGFKGVSSLASGRKRLNGSGGFLPLLNAGKKVLEIT
ncbi:MAG: hypothetical protein LBL19_00210, partial [Spirochaetaceae bacterium]|nr:hypothetical protein [Spirochaetaceae bacterium]